MKTLILMVLIFSFQELNAQTADQLIRINSVANATDMQNISSPHEGSLIYVESFDNLFLRSNNAWHTIWTNRGNSASDSCFIGSKSNHDFRLRTNNVQRMVIKNDGKVGVNLNNPTGIFHVNSGLVLSSNHITGLTASTNSGSGAPSVIDNNNGTYWQSATQWIGGANYNNWVKLDLGTSKIVQRYRLEASSANPTDWHFQGSNDNSNWTTIHSINGASGGAWSVRDYTISSQTTAYRYYRVLMKATLWWYNSSNGIWNNTGYMRLTEFKVFETVVDSTIAGDFIVNLNGNVGVGINPTQKLHVDGNILATGSITPDYVFESYFDGESELNPNYEYKPLEKVKEFVKENKHLPGVPSAAEIKEQGGIIVNRATEINLEKIEELYLYIFELNDQLESLKEELHKCNSKK